MASGLLYSNLQPHKITPQWIQMMEVDRQRRLTSRDEKVKKMEEERANLFKGFEKLDVEGNFLLAATETMGTARRDLVSLYNDKGAGKMTDQEFSLAKESIDDVPLQINAAYQTHEEKLDALTKGDELLNYDAINALTKASVDLKMEYDPKTRRTNVTIKDVNGKDKTMSAKEYNAMVNAIPVAPAQGDPSEKAQTFGNDFKADLIQTGRYTEQGLETGDTMERFNTAWTGSFGSKSAGNNDLIKKWMKTTAEDDTYEDAWESLRAQAAVMIQTTKRTSPTPSSTKTEKSPTAALDKMNFTILTEKGVGGEEDPVLNTIKTANGEVAGIGAAFSLSDSSQRIEIDSSGLEGIPDGVSESIKVNAFFIGKDGSMYIKGSADQLDPIYNIMQQKYKDKKISKSNMDAIDSFFEKRKRGIDFIKIKGSAAADFRSNVLKGKTSKEMETYLQDIVGDKIESTSNTDPLGLGI